MSKRKPRQLGEPPAPRRMATTGRQTRPRGSAFALYPYNYLPRRQYEREDITKLENSFLPASLLLALLPDLSADVGLAVWNILRLGSRGFTFAVKDAAGQDDEQGKALLDGMYARLNARSGGLRGLIVQWLLSAFLQGAVAGEVALAEGLREVEDVYAVDPATIVFTRDEAQQLVAWQVPAETGMRIGPLDPEHFFYIPIDPWIDDPYGRPPAAPVLQEVWFDISVITGLRKVVHNQGWPRIHIKILEEALVNAAPESVKRDPDRLTDWLDARLDEVRAAYDDLAEDDSFVTFDSVEINNAAPDGKIFDASAVVRIIERRMIKALKQLPVLMASNEGVTETHGTVQWTIFVAGLESLQEPIKHILSKAGELALRAAGRQGRVECEFERLSTSDRLKDAQAEDIEITNAIKKWAAGFQTWEESSIEVTGSGPPEGAVEPDPSTLAGGGGAPVGGQLATARYPLSEAVRPDQSSLDERLDREIAAWTDAGADEDGD